MIIALLILLINGGGTLDFMLFDDPYTPLRHCQHRKAGLFPLDDVHRVTVVDYSSRDDQIWYDLEGFSKPTIKCIYAPLGEPLDDYAMRPHVRHMSFLNNVARGVVKCAYPDVVCFATYHCFFTRTRHTEAHLLSLIAAIERNASTLDECAGPHTATNVAYALTKMIKEHWRYEYDAFKQRSYLACPTQHGLETKVRGINVDIHPFWDDVMRLFTNK